MAFVAQTQRKLNEISKTMCPLGPGQYFVNESFSAKRQCAPFQSSTRRRSFLQAKNTIKPGPGNYQISKPFIEPNIKTVSNTQSIIVKINSTGTSQFKSVVDRFDEKTSQMPGPGEYSFDGSERHRKRAISQRSAHEANIIDKIKQLNVKKKYPAIPEKTRGLTDTKKQQVNPQGKLGPAFYNPQKLMHLNSTSAVWGKDKSRRFSVDNKSDLGPGKYNTTINLIKVEDKTDQTSAHFKSNTVRTYFDSLFYKTNVNDTAKLRDLSHFKPKDPAPGQYQVNRSSLKLEEKPFALQFFGSTVERFPVSHIPQKKSKSFYNIKSEIGRDTSFNKSEHAFMSDTNRKPEFLQVNDKVPGPGQYRQNVKVEKKLKGNKLEKFGTNTKRMFQEEDKIQNVGPGKYTKDQSKPDSPKNTKFGQVKEISSNFRSTTGRECFGNNKQSTLFAEYDVTHYDMSKKVEKQKNYIQNLKKIQVQKAPFESSISRFPHYEQKPQNPRKASLEQNKAQQIRLKQIQNRHRQMILQQNQSQIRDVKKNNFGTTERFKNERKGSPSVGQYSVKQNWDIKSHNIKYAHK